MTFNYYSFLNSFQMVNHNQVNKETEPAADTSGLNIIIKNMKNSLQRSC